MARGMRSRTTLTLTSSIGVITAAVVTLASVAPAQAVGDPEVAFQRHARAAGIAGALLDGPRVPSARELLRLANPAASNARIARKLPRRSRNRMIGSRLSVDVVDVVSGARVWGRGRKRAMLPASNMKIVTAANALALLGPDHTFRTTVRAPAVGTVVIKGGGDATLTYGDLELLAGQTVTNLSRQGLLPEANPDGTTPQLRVLVDNSLFPAPSAGPGWTGGYQPSIVRPVYPLGIDGRYVTNSAANAAKAFASYVSKAGYPARFRRAVLPATGSLVADHPSRPLSSQVNYMLQVSENNVAETLYRHVAIARGYEPTWTNSRVAAIETLAQLGVPTRKLGLHDGSGVSRADRLTATALTALLSRVADSGSYPNLYPIYHGGGLPLAGYTGTLSASIGRFKTVPTRCARGRIRAKTGTLYDTVALSGLAMGSDGRLKAFSVLVNNRPYRRYAPLQTRRAVDRIASTLTGCW